MKSLIDQHQAAELLRCEDKEAEELLARAETVRRQHFGREVRLCAITNAKSGACPERCDFCSQSAAFRTAAPVFPLKETAQIVAEARAASAAGAVEFSIVTSGRTIRKEKDIATLEQALKLIGEQTPMERCASLGELPAEILARLSQAGMKRYHHNIETAPSYHPQIVHTHKFDDEVRVVTNAQEAGLLVCCGGILGMGETIEQRVEMAFTLRDLKPACIPLNFLDPRPGTPLQDMRDLTPLTCLKIIAVFRLIMPTTPIFVCGGREKNLGSLQPKIFGAGASGTMTGNYLTTTGQDPDADRHMIESGGWLVQKAKA